MFTSIGYGHNGFRLIRNTGPSRPDESEIIPRLTDKFLTLQRYSLYVGQQFSWAMAKIDHSRAPTSEPMQSVTAHPSEIQVTGEIGFLKRLKTARPDGLLPSVLNDGGGVLR